MKNFEIEDGLYETLEELAIPFKDTTPSMVLNRIVNHYISCEKEIDPASDKPRRRFVLRQYGKLQHEHYRIPIIEALQQLGGRGPSCDVREIVFSKVKDRLNEIDFSKTTTGIIRWQDALRNERQRMLKDGILKPGTLRGIWELNPDFDFNALKPEGDNSK